MNIVFMGTPEFAIPSLNILLKSHHNISAVVTVPDKPRGRGLKLSESAVKIFAKKHNLRILQPERLKDESFVNEIKSLSPDLIIVVAFRILPKEIYSIPKYGSFNLHASLLPKYRGAAPINWAIINGDKQTGVTTFFLKDKVDTGNIIMRKQCDITEADDAGSLHDKLMSLGAIAVEETVDLIVKSNGNPPLKEQEDIEATIAPKIFKEGCRINFNQSVDTVYNFIRGLSPYPGAYTVHKDKLIKVYKSCKTDLVSTGAPGGFSVRDNRIFVSCSDNELEVMELQIEGKNRMNAKDFLNGNNYLLL